MSESALNNQVLNSTNDQQGAEIYRSFNHASQRLAGLVAVDYFFAKEISQCVSFSEPVAIEHDSSDKQWFHLLIALSASLRDGHSCLPISEVAGKRYFTDGLTNASETGNDLAQQGFEFADVNSLNALLAVLPLAEDEQQPIVLRHGRLYLRRYYKFEQELKQVVQARRAITAETEVNTNDAQLAGNSADFDTIKHIIATLFPTLANESVSAEAEIDWQAVAVANAINKDFAIIAGGPGTGKTYTVTKLLAALVMLNAAKNSSKSRDNDVGNAAPKTAPRIALVAPTGKAAQRLSESISNAVQGFRGSIDDKVLDLIPEQAQTIHRLLGVIPEQVNFRHHQENLLAIDILLIDEVSMVDLPMMTRIFRALPASTKVILLGDADQLPSVAVGSVLADFAPRPHVGYSALNHSYLEQVTGYKTLTLDQSFSSNEQYSASDCVTFLMKSRRFDGEGGIGKIANNVINGQYRESWQLLAQSSAENSELDEQSQLTLLSGSTESWLTPLVERYYFGLSQCDSVEEAFALLAKFRILSSTRKGPQGVESLNAMVIEILRDKGAIAFNRYDSANNANALYPSQPIMINENDYRLGVYNGDIGLLWKNAQGHLMAVFENGKGGFEWILPSRLPKFDTVYAMTIHKTQGSEFQHVAMVLPEQKDNRLLSRELLYTGITRAKLQLSIACSQQVWQSGVSQQVKRHSGLAVD